MLGKKFNTIVDISTTLNINKQIISHIPQSHDKDFSSQHKRVINQPLRSGLRPLPCKDLRSYNVATNFELISGGFRIVTLLS